MEAQGDPFRRGLPTLQTSLTHPELPPCPRHLGNGILFRFSEVAGTWGKFFCFGREVIFLKVRLSRLFCGWGAYGVCVFCKCRLIPPHQSLTRQTACSFLPSEGKPFARFLSYYATKDEESIYTRPHPSPTVTPSPSKGKASVGSASYIKSASNFIFCKINSPEHIFPKKQIQMRTLRTRAFPFEGEGGAAGDG